MLKCYLSTPGGCRAFAFPVTTPSRDRRRVRGARQLAIEARIEVFDKTVATPSLSCVDSID